MELNLNIPERMKHYHVTGLSISIIDSCRITQVEKYGVLEARTHKKVNSQSIFRECSISKFLTAILVMMLTEQGILDLDPLCCRSYEGLYISSVKEDEQRITETKQPEIIPAAMTRTGMP